MLSDPLGAANEEVVFGLDEHCLSMTAHAKAGYYWERDGEFPLCPM